MLLSERGKGEPSPDPQGVSRWGRGMPVEKEGAARKRERSYVRPLQKKKEGKPFTALQERSNDKKGN